MQLSTLDANKAPTKMTTTCLLTARMFSLAHIGQLLGTATSIICVIEFWLVASQFMSQFGGCATSIFAALPSNIGGR
jgi:hypothetical protein